MNALLATACDSVESLHSVRSASDFAAEPDQRKSPGQGLAAEIPGLIDQVRTLLKQRHYAKRTESAYVEWIHQFLRFCPGREVASLGEADLRAFLEQLASRPEITPGGRTQARAAVLVLFHGVLGQRFNCADGLGVAGENSGAGLLTRPQVDQLVAAVAAVDLGLALVVAILRGTDLRPAETLALRVRDIDLEGGCIHVRDERGHKPLRVVALPQAVLDLARTHLTTLQVRHQADLAKNAGYASLPDDVRLADPQARRALEWQWLFPTGQIARDPLSHEGRRRHLEVIVVQRAVIAAARSLGITQPITLQTLRTPPRQDDEAAPR
jgi:integrase